jgi:hypothetical protein
LPDMQKGLERERGILDFSQTFENWLGTNLEQIRNYIYQSIHLTNTCSLQSTFSNSQIKMYVFKYVKIRNRSNSLIIFVVGFTGLRGLNEVPMFGSIKEQTKNEFDKLNCNH